MKRFATLPSLKTLSRDRPSPWVTNIGIGAGLSVAGLGIGFFLTQNHLPSAAAIAVVPALLCLVLRRIVAAIVLGISIPLPISLVGGSAGGLNVAASDIFVTAFFVAILVDVLITGRRDLFLALKPLALPLAPYLAWMVVLIAAHPGGGTAVQTGQRLELFLFPILVGAAVAMRGWESPLLKAYVITATGLAALYPIFSNDAGAFGIQKNPAGQFIANALLLFVATRSLRGRLLFTVPVLTLGLLWTQSRGAILSVVVGLIVLLVVKPGRERVRLVALLIPIAVVAAGAFALLPEEAQQRNTSFNAGTDSRAAYSLEIREKFRAEAWQMIHAEPLLGTGVGRYFYGVDGIYPSTVDPHQVLLLQAAEGGYLLAGGFVILVLGSAAVIAVTCRRTEFGPAAVALLVAAVGHGLVDVYWVRGTPVLSWLLIGMAAGRLQASRTPDHTGPDPEADVAQLGAADLPGRVYART
jgi:hypothetical protein